MRFLLSLSAALALSACSGPAILNAVAPKLSGQWERQTDIAYGEIERQKLDVYMPTSEGPHPVLVFIHGGSWEKGNKNDYPWLGRRFASEGYVTAVINYRLSPEFDYDDFMADVAKAVAYVHENASEWGGDPDRLFLAGHSAGAYNAVQVAVAPEFLEAEGTSPDIIDGVAGIAGPYSFLPLDSRVTKAAFGGADDLKATQPVNRLTPDAPPMILLHGKDDDVVSPKNSTELARMLEGLGVEARSVLYDDIDHIEIIVAVALTDRAPVVADMTGFFEGLDAR
ncbi:alpha/beta hydrolase [Parvularcula lutaonensis]|uniref:Alpha/beta hydrolase n=1 Tax=Parvularcula lutaonensis TaxID=491923 RepID=A0ABV7M909_9PROT|nr:alpha/beta hydrolase [Parvularcula lutaonensis]